MRRFEQWAVNSFSGTYLVLCSEAIYYPSDPVAAIIKLNSLGDFILVTYTTWEGDQLDRIFAKIPALYRASCRYLRLFDAGRIVNRHGCRLVLWWSGALTREVLQRMQAESGPRTPERATVQWSEARSAHGR